MMLVVVRALVLVLAEVRGSQGLLLLLLLLLCALRNGLGPLLHVMSCGAGCAVPHAACT